MNSKALAVVLIVCAAVGTWWFAKRDAADPSPISPPLASVGNAAPATPANLENARLVAGSGAPAADAPDAGRVEAPVADAPAVTGAGTVMLRGRLVDSGGAPRAGTVLTLRSWEGVDGLEFLPPSPARNRDELPSWTTRSDGTFQIPLAKNRLGMLGLTDDSLVFASEPAPIAASKGDQDLGDVRVLRGGVVQGIVQDERGLGVAGVKVQVTVDALGLGGLGSAVSSADGAFSVRKLRPGKWSLRTSSGKFLPTTVEIELGAEEQKTGVVIVVKAGNAIAGQVVDDRGVGVSGMRVGSKRKEARGSLDIERFSPDESTSTDANGYFTLSGLADEAATVRAFGPGHSPATAGDVPVGTGNLVLRVERLGAIEGVLVGGDGKPIAGSRVRAQAGAEAGLMIADEFGFEGVGAARGAETAADGSFRIESVPPGTAMVIASGKAHRPARQPDVAVLPAQTTKGVRLVADLGASAQVQVLDEAGQPVAGAKVTAERAAERGLSGGGTFRARAVAIEDHNGEVSIGGAGPLGSATTDEQGRATLAGLPSGNVSFAATHADYAKADAVRVAVPKAGVVEAALTMRKPGDAEITVRGTDGAPQSGVALLVTAAGDAGGEPTRVVSDDGGLARVRSLAPGPYDVAISRAPSRERFGDAMVFVGGGDESIAASRQRFTVVAGETTRVDLQRPLLARVHGVVTGAEGPAAGVQLVLRRDGEDAPELPGFGGRQATTAADGTFAFEDVEAGAYVIDYGKRDQVVKAQHPLEVPANTAELRTDLALRTGKVRVQVVAAGSMEGVAKAEVELVRASASNVTAGAPPRTERRVMMVSMSVTNDGNGGEETTTMTAGAPRAVTDEDGVAEIDDVPVGDYTLRIRHKKHAPFELKNQVVAERQLTDCGRVELAGAGQIRGKVVDADGKPARMALVTSRPADSQQWSEPQMAQGGSYRLQGLAAGKYLVRAQAIGPTAGAYSPEVEVEVKAGEVATTDLQLPAK
jgi:hypothetical protein